MEKKGRSRPQIAGPRRSTMAAPDPSKSYVGVDGCFPTLKHGVKKCFVCLGGALMGLGWVFGGQMSAEKWRLERSLLKKIGRGRRPSDRLLGPRPPDLMHFEGDL